MRIGQGIIQYNLFHFKLLRLTHNSNTKSLQSRILFSNSRSPLCGANKGLILSNPMAQAEKLSLRSKISSAYSLSSPFNHLAMGTRNPRFLRFTISGGNFLSINFLNIYLLVQPLILNPAGKAAANSISLWSKNGARASREWAIVILSTLDRKQFGRRFSNSKNIIRDKKSRRTPFKLNRSSNP